jgi:hypothetical protein
MFYLRYDDIEGLFRDAAENYQINADKAFDWERVNRIVHEEPGEQKKPEPENKRRRFLLWFLLMVSIGLLSYNIWSVESEKKLLEKSISEADKSIHNNNKESNRKADIVRDEKSNLKKNDVNAGFKIDNFTVNKNKIDYGVASGNANQKTRFLIVPHWQYTADQNINSTGTEDESAILNKKINADINPDPFPIKERKTQSIVQQLDKDIPHLIEPLDKPTNKSTEKNTASKNKEGRFYAGAFIAPDVTFIKFQQTNGVGATFGLTAGYQLSKKWSIETGISLDTKKYYTDGEYFDKSDVPAFYNAQLLSVNGSCNMLEVPINLRYKFSSNNNNHFTAAVGTSSYFMTKESYNYSMLAWGQTIDGKFTNYPSSTHLFAVINLSAGYEKKINNVNLLLEPYYKVPVKGIGSGNLYMSSAGINIGIKKYFGKK